MTTRMRLGCFSTLVPCSACAESAADVRLRIDGNTPPTPMPYIPRTRKPRGEHEQPTCRLAMTNLTNHQPPTTNRVDIQAYSAPDTATRATRLRPCACPSESRRVPDGPCPRAIRA